jgi:hypothetical protein
MSRKRLDLVGQRFCRLFVVKFAYMKNNHSYFGCECDCGERIIVSGNSLTSNNTKSCGCLQKEIVARIGRANKDKLLSEETKQKLSEANKGKNNPMYGKHRSEETKRKISESAKGRKRPEMSKRQTGKNNPNYKHGLKGTKEYRNAQASKHRAMKLNQTPANADQTKIQKIYLFCARLNETGFFRYEVDHIKPLRSYQTT